MAAYFFASPIDVDIKLNDEEGRKVVEIKGDKDRTIPCPVYYDGESVGGTVCAEELVHTDHDLLTATCRSQYEYGMARR